MSARYYTPIGGTSAVEEVRGSRKAAKRPSYNQRGGGLV